MFVSVLLLLLWSMPSSAPPFSLSAQSSSDSAKVPPYLTTFSPIAALSSSNPPKSSQTLATWLAIERVPFTTDNVGGDAVLVRAEHCSRPCAQMLGSVGATPIPRVRCVCRCPPGEQIFVQTAEGGGKCATKAPDCPGRTFRFDRSLDSSDPPMFAPVLNIPHQGEALSNELRIAWKESGVKVRAGHGPRCSIQSAFLLASQAIWRPLDGDLFKLGWLDGEGRMIWTGNEKDAEELVGGIVQLVLECAAGKSGNASFCVAFRVEGQIESPFASGEEDSTVMGDVGVELDRVKRAEVVAIILLAILLFLSVFSSIFLWNVCWRMEKRKLIQSLQLQFLHYAKQEKDKTIAECQLRYQALVKAAAGVQQNRQQGAASPHIGIANGGFLNGNGATGLTTDGEEEQYGMAGGGMDTPQQQRRKLYFSAEFFEPQLMSNPPPMAEQFLYDLRKMVAVARERIRTRRHVPRLHAIVESDDEGGGGGTNAKQIYSAKDEAGRNKQQKPIQPQREETERQADVDEPLKKFKQYPDHKPNGRDAQQKMKQCMDDKQLGREAREKPKQNVADIDDNVGRDSDKGMMKQFTDDKACRNDKPKPTGGQFTEMKQPTADEAQRKSVEEKSRQISDEEQIGMDVWKRIKQFSDLKQNRDSGIDEKSAEKMKQHSVINRQLWHNANKDIKQRDEKPEKETQNKQMQFGRQNGTTKADIKLNNNEDEEKHSDGVEQLEQVGREEALRRTKKHLDDEKEKWERKKEEQRTDESINKEKTEQFTDEKKTEQFTEEKKTEQFTEEKKTEQFTDEKKTEQFTDEKKTEQFTDEKKTEQFTDETKTEQFIDEKKTEQFIDDGPSTDGAEKINGTNAETTVSNKFTDAKDSCVNAEKGGVQQQQQTEKKPLKDDEPFGMEMPKKTKQFAGGKQLMEKEEKVQNDEQNGEEKEQQQFDSFEMPKNRRPNDAKQSKDAGQNGILDVEAVGRSEEEKRIKCTNEKQQNPTDLENAELGHILKKHSDNEAQGKGRRCWDKFKQSMDGGGQFSKDYNGFKQMQMFEAFGQIYAERLTKNGPKKGGIPFDDYAEEGHNSKHLAKEAKMENNDMNTAEQQQQKESEEEEKQPQMHQTTAKVPKSADIAMPSPSPSDGGQASLNPSTASDNLSDDDTSTTPSSTSEEEDEKEDQQQMMNIRIKTAKESGCKKIDFLPLAPAISSSAKPEPPQQNQPPGHSRIPIGVASTSGSNGTKLPRANPLAGTSPKQRKVPFGEQQQPPLPAEMPPNLTPAAEDGQKMRMKSMLQQPSGSVSLTSMKRRVAAAIAVPPPPPSTEKASADSGTSNAKNHGRLLLNNLRSAIPTSIPCPTSHCSTSSQVASSSSFPPSSVSYAVAPPDNHIKKSLPRRKKLNSANGSGVPHFATNGNGMATNLKMPTVV